MAASGHIGPTKVRYRRDPGALGNNVRIADLKGKRIDAVRSVANGLAMRAYRNHGGGIDVSVAQQRQRGGGKTLAYVDVQTAKRVKFHNRIGGRECEQAFAHVGRIRRGARSNDLEVRMKTNERRINAIGAGTGDQTQPQGRVGGCFASHMRRKRGRQPRLSRRGQIGRRQPS